MAATRSRWLLFMVPLVGGSLVWLWAGRGKPSDDDAIVTTVKQGPFKAIVTAAGELRARTYVEIKGPGDAMRAGRFQMQIATLVPEGTIVKKGDFVAELDRAALAPRLQEVETALEKAEAQLTAATLDTALSLAHAREETHDLESKLEENQLAKERSIYEAPSVRRQADLNLEKAERELARARASYATKGKQAVAKVEEPAGEARRQRAKLDAINQAMEGFTIRAPAAGMVIYVREWNGRKRGAGSAVSPWEPAVATLPDLSEMESLTYVNEIDIRKVVVGQPVRIALDADPSERLTGRVTTVANVGEQRPNSDAKVFAVTVQVDESDLSLRPGMTTSNAIETASLPNALSLPLEAVMADVKDDVTFVYKRTGMGVVRQEIATGLSGENDIVVLRGLVAGDRVLLTEPPHGHDLPLVRLR